MGSGGIGSYGSMGLNSNGIPSTDEMEEEYSTPVSTDITIQEAKDILGGVLQTDVVPFLWGPPGIGKSSIVKQICEEKGWKMIDFRLSTVNPVDLMGMPTVDKEKGVAKWLPPEYLPPPDAKDVGVLFLDELNLAPLSVQAAAYQLILDKRVGAYRFPKTWKMVAAGNRETDKANVYKISAPLANRFMHLSIRPDLNAWLKWAKGKVSDQVLSFLQVRIALLFKMPTDSQKAFPTPRSWEYVSNFIKSFNYVAGTKPSRAFEIAVMGAVGEAVGQEFLKYISEYKLQEVNQIVDRFFKTGELELPKGSKSAELSMRYTIANVITNAYKRNEIDRPLFEKFLGKLTPEERGVMRSLLAQQTFSLSENEKYTFLESDLSVDTASMLVNDSDVFVSSSGFAEIISPDGKDREIVNYRKTPRGKGISIDRAQNGTSPKSFLAGSMVKPL